MMHIADLLWRVDNLESALEGWKNAQEKLERERDELQAALQDTEFDCDALLTAGLAALTLLTRTGQDGTPGHHPNNPVLVMLRAAITKARGKTDVG